MVKPVPTATPTPVATTSSKPLTPLYRNFRTSTRYVRSYYGDVNPLYRNFRTSTRYVRSYWGDTDPAQMAAVAGAPAYAGIDPFWDGLGEKWDEIDAKWQNAGVFDPQNPHRFIEVASGLKGLVDASKGFWTAAVQKQTGKSFEAGFSNAFMARYGLNLDDPATLAKLSVTERAAFLLDWHDGLMAFSGTDRVDWWMGEVNWSPQLSQRQGSGIGMNLGLVDDFGIKSTDLATKVTNLNKNGVDTSNGHGEGVLSLMVSAHDGKGIMGIAPNAKVFGYNPFDAQGGADWAGVKAAIVAVSKMSNVINLSLGQPGMTLSPEWAKIFKTSEVNTHKDRNFYVIAAGNDGIPQTGNINMEGGLDNTFVVVGSVGPGGVISEFSNRPGNACLTLSSSGCEPGDELKESGYLRNRFIVAPGELILVSDGKGGLVRQSGTSLAAPLVSATALLLGERWPWLKEKPRALAEIILKSARDLGPTGVDDTYGVGMLDVEGALSPLDYSKLDLKIYNSSGTRSQDVTIANVRSQTQRDAWARSNMYLHAFEDLPDGERDFRIPMSSQLHGKMMGGEYFQDFVYNRMVAAIGTTRFGSTGVAGFADGHSTGAINRGDGWTMSLTGRMVNGYAARGQYRRMTLHSTVEVQAPSGAFGFQFGQGDGAAALGGQGAMALNSDLDPYSGGVNPLLGFANGGMHMGARVGVAPGLDVKAGFSQQRRGRGLDLYGVTDIQERAVIGGMERYSANASNVRVDFRAAPWLELSASVTRLAEPNAFLGTRSLTAANLTGGTTTDGVTLGADVSLGSGFALIGSATGSRSSSQDDVAALRTADGGVVGSSYQVGVAKQGLLGNTDRMRLTVAQPLRMQGGSMELTQMQVVDRRTGEKGFVTERFSVNGLQPNRLVVEGLYGAPLMDGRGEIGLFGRGEMRELDAGAPRLMLGGQFRLGL